jgi:peptide/nickel transport system substrate-binding protein
VRKLLVLVTLFLGSMLLGAGGLIPAHAQSASRNPANLEPSSVPGCPVYGGTFVTVLPADPSPLNPALTTGYYAHTFTDLAYNSLVDTNDGVHFTPGLAYNWTVSSDGLTYTFHLYQNVTWQDGVPFTSADVKYTFLSILIPYHPEGKANFGVIKSIDTPDNYTVVFNLSGPWPSFLTLVGNTFTAPILPLHVWNGTNILNNTANSHPMGTGPFEFVSYTPGNEIIYQRNPHYFKAPLPCLDSIVIKVIPDINTMVQAFQTDEIDTLYPEIPAAIFNQLRAPGEAAQGINASTSGANMLPGVEFLYFNLNNTILSNLKVREAIAYAVNRTQVSAVSRENVSPPALGPISYLSTQYYDPKLQPSYPTNTTMANQLLNQAGYPAAANGTRFSLQLEDNPGSISNNDDLVIKSDLAQVGINVIIKEDDVATGTTLVFLQRNFQMAIRGFYAGPDPTLALNATFCSCTIGAGSFTNAMGYNSSVADKLLWEATTETNVTLRAQLLTQWQSQVMTDLPGIPLVDNTYEFVWHTYVHNWPSSQWLSSTMFPDYIWLSTGKSVSAVTSSAAASTSTASSGSVSSGASTSMVTTTSSPSTTVSSSSGSNSTLLVSAAAVIVLVVIVGAVVVMRRRRP